MSLCVLYGDRVVLICFLSYFTRGPSCLHEFLYVLYEYQTVCTCLYMFYKDTRLCARVVMCFIRGPGCLHMLLRVYKAHQNRATSPRCVLRMQNSLGVVSSG